MNSAVCTLFEGHYHHGVAALTNSLYRHGFRGSVYAGYQGVLPIWADKAKEDLSLQWIGGRTLQVAYGLNIHFLPVNTEYHFTNYKPNFMMQLWEGPAKGTEMIAYFDPDIVIKCKWEFFEIWMSHGVALVHEISSNDMPPSHPLRKEWEKVVYKSNKKITRELYSLINAGFCGVSIHYLEFLETWKEVFETGEKFYQLTPDQWIHEYDRTYLFHNQDQDALNIAAMCSESPISEVGPEGMDFIHGGFTMSHAIGSPKPWKKNYLLSSIKGKLPSIADKAYWLNVYGPIKCFNLITINIKRTSILFASFIGRFYSRS